MRIRNLQLHNTDLHGYPICLQQGCQTQNPSSTTLYFRGPRNIDNIYKVVLADIWPVDHESDTLAILYNDLRLLALCCYTERRHGLAPAEGCLIICNKDVEVYDSYHLEVNNLQR